ncbi:MAG TPA: AI-2E family transporter [Thermomicrobiales bacterium]|nr:AI-2E family transporter [Thermomicrobiales bacterium]
MVQRPGESGGTHTIRVEVSWRTFLGLLALVVSLWLLVRLWQIIVLILVALVLAGTLAPALDWLERHRVRRPLALVLVLLALVAAVVGLGVLIIPALVGQVEDLVANAPAWQQRLADTASHVGPLSSQAAAIRRANPDRYLTPIGKAALDYAPTAASGMLDGLTAVVLAFYLLADQERVKGFGFALLPRRFHLRAARLLLGLQTIVGGYVRGQAITSFLIGGFTFVLLVILGVPHALALGVFASFADLIPFIGPVIATVLPVIAALQRGPATALIVLVALIAYQQLESHLIIPRVYGQTLRLSPVAVVVSLLIGGALLGIIGALLALPIAAGIRAAVEEFRIELPGDQPAERAQRLQDARAEAVYAHEAAGTTAVEAAAMATELAVELQEETIITTGQAETPIEERDPRAARRPGG